MGRKFLALPGSDHSRIQRVLNEGPSAGYAARTMMRLVDGTPLSNEYVEEMGVSVMAPGRMDITWLEEKHGAVTYRGRALNPRPT